MAFGKASKLAIVLSATDKMSRIIDSAVKKSTKSLSSFERNMTAAGGAMTKAGALMVGAGVAIGTGVYQLAKSAADYAGGIYDASRAAGVGVETFQRMSYAAKMSGVDMEKMSGGLVRLSRQIYDAGNGSQVAAQTFRDLGIDLKDAGGNFRDTEAIFGDIAERFKNMPAGVERTALATRMFGRSGAGMIDMLANGRDGLAAFYSEAERLGLVLDEKTVVEAENFGDELETVGMQIGAVKNRLGVALIPIVQQLASRVGELSVKISDWIKENPKLIETIGKVVSVLADMLLHVGGFLAVVGPVVFGIGKAVTTFKLLAEAIKTTSGTFKILNIVTKGNAVMLIITAIAIAAYFIIKYWGPIKGFFIRLWNWIKNIFKSAWEWIKKMFLNYHPVGLVIKHWDKIKGFFVRIWGAVKNIFKSTWEWIKNMFLNYHPVGLVIKHWEKLGDFFSGLGARFFEWGRNLINSLWEGIKSMVNCVVEGAKGVAQKIAGAFKSFFGINSPSKLFTEYGVNITQGLAIGLDHGADNAASATQGMAMQVTRGAERAMTANADSASQVANSYGGTSIQYAPNITIQGNMGPQEQQEFLRLLRQHGSEIVDIINRNRQNNTRLSFA